jgi:glycine/serine hydroxymethyltransferase
MGKPQMEQIGDLIVRVLKNHQDQQVIEKSKDQILSWCNAFPLYGAQTGQSI